MVAVFMVVIFVWTAGHIFDKSNGETILGSTNPYLDDSYFFYRQSHYPRDCEEINDQCSPSGVYYIKPDGYPEPFEVYCDVTDDLAGWMIIQRRGIDNIVSFNRSWDDYKNGFGFLSRDFWIGNSRLCYLTNQKDYQLLIEMDLSNGSAINVSYNNFRISDEFNEYKLFEVSQYSGRTESLSWIQCPNNMVHDNCTCGQRSCQEPTVCQDTCDRDEPLPCICPEGFYMNGEDCVPEEKCGCFLTEEQTVIPEGESYVNSDCTRIDHCTDGQFVRNSAYVCSNNGECDERGGVRRCYCNEGYRGDGETCITSSTDCMDVYNSGSTSSGTYTIKPTNWPGGPFSVYCNMTDGGGWTVFQRRIDGDVEFHLNWESYKNGFGDVSDEHWLGNDKLYYFTHQRTYQLRLDLVNRNGAPYYAKYSSFRINSETDNYRLSGLGTYSGNAGDPLTSHRGELFSTKDRDNDGGSSGHCAVGARGAWWYFDCCTCRYCDLNGRYNGHWNSRASIYWKHLPGSPYNLRFSEMKLRPA